MSIIVLTIYSAYFMSNIVYFQSISCLLLNIFSLFHAYYCIFSAYFTSIIVYFQSISRLLLYIFSLFHAYYCIFSFVCTPGPLRIHLYFHLQIIRDSRAPASPSTIFFSGPEYKLKKKRLSIFSELNLFLKIIRRASAPSVNIRKYTISTQLRSSAASVGLRTLDFTLFRSGGGGDRCMPLGLPLSIFC